MKRECGAPADWPGKTIRVRGRSSGAESEIPTAVVAEYRDGLLVRYKDYGEARAALRAAGLDE